MSTAFFNICHDVPDCKYPKFAVRNIAHFKKKIWK